MDRNVKSHQNCFQESKIPTEQITERSWSWTGTFPRTSVTIWHCFGRINCNVFERNRTILWKRMTAKCPKSKYYDIINGPVSEKYLRENKMETMLFALTDLQIKPFGRHTGQNIHYTAKTASSNLIKNCSSWNSSNIQFLKLKLEVRIRLAILHSAWHSSKISVWWGSCFLERWKNTDTRNSEIMWLQGNFFSICLEAWRFIYF